VSTGISVILPLVETAGFFSGDGREDVWKGGKRGERAKRGAWERVSEKRYGCRAVD